ncbi:HNH endonuclease signature motif containing protein [Paenibacillus sp. M-152]|uniref:HNH endonuclease n=1 Tax=Paenibacillus sp. M-152 TaxID=2487928 RepID=UPI000F718E2E|nr:HNH endonuclease signature motif containing protein [Paenibacillus sp. M-152]AZH30503.1 HNH endonuclease [Paenibacillus sp. M-152]
MEKKSNIHRFIEFVIDELFYEESLNLSKSKCRDRTNYDFDNPTYITPFEYVFREYKIDHLSFMNWREDIDDELSEDQFHEYYLYLYETDEYSRIIESLGEDVFYILFLNRELLQEFNQLFASYLEMCNGDEVAKQTVLDRELQEIVRDDYKLYRVNIPEWVKRAVYFRDRGMCVTCGKDLSGYLSLDNKENYDHIVPLNLYGFNDVSNIQLLCRECNSGKSGNQSLPTTRYQSWY